jgi:hypothetical protein
MSLPTWLPIRYVYRGRTHVIREEAWLNQNHVRPTLCGLSWYLEEYVRALDVEPEQMPGICGTCLKISKIRKENDE